MKSLGALLLLGAANYVAADYQDLREHGHVNYGVFDGTTRKLIKDGQGDLTLANFPAGDILRIVCEKASEVVKAWNNVAEDYEAFQAQIKELEIDQSKVRTEGGQPDRSAFSTDSVLVYACKVQKQDQDTSQWNDQPINSATNKVGDVTSSVAIQGSYVRVHYEGTCVAGIDTTVFESKMLNSEDYKKKSDYTAPLNLTAVFPCIQPMGFRKKIVFDLQYKPTDEAKLAGIIDDAVTTGEVYFTKNDRALTGDGRTFNMEHDVLFNLGAEKPHPQYYESGVDDCTNSGTDEDLCKGGLKSTLILSSTASKSFSVATELVDYTTIGTGFKFRQCFHKPNNPLSGTKVYDYLEACYGKDVRDRVKAWTSAQNSAKYTLAAAVAADVLEARDSSDGTIGSDGDGSGSLLTDMICPFTCPDIGSASCPFNNSNTDDSTSASALACLSVGVKHNVGADSYSPKFWDNRCAARTDGLTGGNLTTVLNGTEAAEDLRTPYSFTQKFTRGTGNQEQFVNPANVTFQEYAVDLHSNVIRHDVTMKLPTDTFANLISQAAFFTVEGDSFVQEVSLNTNTLTIENVPTYVKTLTLKGQVFKTCDREKVILSNAMPINIGKPLLTSGVFRPVDFDADDLTKHDPCNPLFEYVRTSGGAGQDTAYAISGVLRGESFEADPSLVKMCDEAPGSATSTSCARVASHSSSVKPNHTNPVALLEGLCSVNGFPRNPGVIGALVAFSDERAYAPVICPGTCRQSTIHNISLDWDIELAVSASDNLAGATNKTDHNKLIVRQETSDWGDNEVDTDETPNRYYDLERVAYLIPATRDDCQADGTLSIDDDSIPTNKVAKHATDSPGCLVYTQSRSKTAQADWATATEYSGIVKAKDMVDWFKACGSQTALGAEVNLVQRFKVTYGDKRDISFCQTKRLSVTVQEIMVGESTQTLTTVQQEDSTDSASIVAVLNQVQYTDDGCASLPGTYRLQAVADITTSVDITADYENSPLDFKSSLTAWAAPANNSNDGQFTWSTECLDICDSAPQKLVTLSKPQILKVELDEVSGGSQAELDIEFTINMEGSPCDGSSEVNKASAELTLYNAGAALPVPDCATAYGENTSNTSPRALTDMVCGRLNVTGLGDSTLYIMRTKLTRQLPGSAAELLCESATTEEDDANGESCVGAIRNNMFGSSGNTGEVGVEGHFIKFADSPIKLFADDAFATLRYTIFWEQRLAGRRRLLRSEMILGAGESTVVGDLVVLPISDQIEDAVESLEEGGQADTTDTTDTTDTDSGLSGGIIALIVGGSVAAVAGVGYVVMQSGGVKLPTLFKEKRTKDGYSVVRRNERFSTMNF